MKLSKLVKSKAFIGLVAGAFLATGVLYFGFAEVKRTSTNEYCESCHVHPHSTETWKQGPHYRTASGVVVNCVECHLPPEGVDHLVEKAKAGARDLYAFYFTDISTIDWDAKSSLEHAKLITFDDACSRCHVELFPMGLEDKGVDAHLHYRKNKEELFCVNCHLKTGHYHDEPDVQMVDLGEAAGADEAPVDLAPLLSELPEGAFEDYTEVIPGTQVQIEMVAVNGGTFAMGSAEGEPDRDTDETYLPEVEVSPYWIGKFEVSWRQYDAYYAETVTRGKNEGGIMTDAITGPTPPYGSPDQGWGKGDRPAITMTPYAARKFCEWLSMKTGRKYRLPTEAEWEFAARGGEAGSYFFSDEATNEGWFDKLKNSILGGSSVDEALLGEYAWYRANSKLKTYPGRSKKPNPLGIYNMYGNVKEFCRDFYAPDLQSVYSGGQKIVNPIGPATGEEFVVRGGSYKSEANDLRSSAREPSRHKEWLRTDPQTPKSVWWYSDTNEVGFRIVREVDK